MSHRLFHPTGWWMKPGPYAPTIPAWWIWPANIRTCTAITPGVTGITAAGPGTRNRPRPVFRRPGRKRPGSSAVPTARTARYAASVRRPNCGGQTWPWRVHWLITTGVWRLPGPGRSGDLMRAIRWDTGMPGRARVWAVRSANNWCPTSMTETAGCFFPWKRS